MRWWRTIRRQSDPCRLAVLLLTAAGPLLPHSLAQNPGTTSSTLPFTLSGTVSNGLDGSPIPRALVQINGRAALTDALGHFFFPSFVGSTGSVQVIKQGYAKSPDDPGAPSSIPVADLTLRLDLKLYPNAIITGTVVGSDRLPLANVQVILLHENIQENGQGVLPVGFARTDSHGQYRFSEPPGRYRLAVPYAARATVDGYAMLPIDYPEDTSSEWPAMFSVASREERHIDLHPRTAISYPVRFRLAGEEMRFNPRVTVKTSSGSSFTLFARTSQDPGLLEIALPSGAYQLRVTTQNREQPEQAEAQITVAGRPVTGLELHLVATPSIPVELTSAATASAANGVAATPPRLNAFGIRLQNLAHSEQFGNGNDVFLSAMADQVATLQASPGLYRLRGQGTGGWYIRSATFRGVDLLTHSFTADAGTGDPIRLVTANDTGRLVARVTGGEPHAISFVYILAHQPSLTPVLQGTSDANGAYSRSLPPGTYTVYAFPRRYPADLHNPAVAARLQGGTEVSVPAAADATLEVPLQTVGQTQ